MSICAFISETAVISEGTTQRAEKLGSFLAKKDYALLCLNDTPLDLAFALGAGERVRVFEQGVSYIHEMSERVVNSISDLIPGVERKRSIEISDLSRGILAVDAANVVVCCCQGSNNPALVFAKGMGIPVFDLNNDTQALALFLRGL